VARPSVESRFPETGKLPLEDVLLSSVESPQVCHLRIPRGGLRPWPSQVRLLTPVVFIRARSDSRARSLSLSLSLSLRHSVGRTSVQLALPLPPSPSILRSDESVRARARAAAFAGSLVFGGSIVSFLQCDDARRMNGY